MMSCHLISTWHEWNVNAGDIMVMLLVYDANLVTSCWACASHAHMYGAHAIIKMGASKYSNGLTANSNLGKLTASHFKALITQNANENMPPLPVLVLNKRRESGQNSFYFIFLYIS